MPAFTGAPPTPAARRSAVLRAAPSGSGNLLTVEQAKKALELQTSRSAEARGEAVAATVPDARCVGPRHGAHITWLALHMYNIFQAKPLWFSRLLC